MAVLRSLRLSFTAALGLIVFSVAYLSYSNNLIPGGGPRHSLLKTDDIGLIPPLSPIPRRNFASLAKYPPHNINNPAKYAFSTLYCTRSADMRGPYFEAVQSIIWRVLWSDYKSQYPIIIFVCPFTPKENRDIFRGMGAIVKEIELLDNIIPDEKISTKRWIDVLSKLNIWKEVEWNRIVFLDGDAFPILNIDDIFDKAPVQKCKKDGLGPWPVDKALIESGSTKAEDMCNYVYSGVPQFTVDNINAGMMIMKPNLDMHARILRAARKTEDYDVRYMEQGVLKSINAFSLDGPFPVHHMDKVWNAVPEYYLEWKANNLEARDGPIRILHAKLWNQAWALGINATELSDRWDLDWMNMCRFYDDEPFEKARQSGIFKNAWTLYWEKNDPGVLVGNPSEESKRKIEALSGKAAT